MPSPQPFLHLGFLLCLVWEALTASSPSPALSLSACVLRSQVLRPPSQSWERRPLLSFSFRTWATKKEATCPERITFQQARPHFSHRRFSHTGLETDSLKWLREHSFEGTNGC